MQRTDADGMAPGTPRHPLLNAITTAFATWAHAEVDDRGAYLLGEGPAGTLIQVKALQARMRSKELGSLTETPGRIRPAQGVPRVFWHGVVNVVVWRYEPQVAPQRDTSFLASAPQLRQGRDSQAPETTA